MTTPHVRVRFAPSPTGNPHVGNFRTALYNFLYARHHQGEFLLRIEDTDRERSRTEYEQAILESMKWMGMTWDGEPVRQSARIERHQHEANRLLAEGKAYRCRCTAEELEQRREEMLAAGKKPMYDARCRDKNYPDDGTPFCIRLKTPERGQTAIHDLVRGEIVVENGEIDDLVIIRTDGTPTYNFAVVIDDHDMEITHVIRGDDHINNTIRQVVLYNELLYPLPEFVHLPQILGEDRTRLSKRHGATGVLEYRDQGYLPEALMNYLARLGWAHGDQEFFTPEQLIECFSIENINRSPAVFDTQKLLWLNGEHIRAKSIPELTGHFIDYVSRKGLLDEAFCREPQHRPYLEKIIACTQERSRTLDEAFRMVAFLFQESLEYPEKDARKIFTADAVTGLQDLKEFAERRRTNPPSTEEWEQEFQRIMEQRTLKMKTLAQAVRLGLTGTKISPPIFDVIDLMGIDRVIQRLHQAVSYSQTLV
jgi:glutamyl-tRNA synthetase